MKKFKMITVKRSVIKKSLRKTPRNDFKCFEETVRRRTNAVMWDVETEIKVEELLRVGAYDNIYKLLLQRNGIVEKWSKMFAYRYNLDQQELFSDFQLYLYNMLDGIANKYYNRDISFMQNLFRQLKCLTIDKYKYVHQKKRRYDDNCIENIYLEQIADTKNYYEEVDLVQDIKNLNCSSEEKEILLKLLSGEICRQDILEILGWSNEKDRMKLSRFCTKLFSYLFNSSI